MAELQSPGAFIGRIIGVQGRVPVVFSAFLFILNFTKIKLFEITIAFNCEKPDKLSSRLFKDRKNRMIGKAPISI
jgi:hypothetical protein